MPARQSVHKAAVAGAVVRATRAFTMVGNTEVSGRLTAVRWACLYQAWLTYSFSPELLEPPRRCRRRRLRLRRTRRLGDDSLEEEATGSE